MKKSIKISSTLCALTLFLVSCTANTTVGELVGTVNARNVSIPYFDEVFPPGSTTDTTSNVPEKTDANRPVIFDKSGAVIVPTMTAVFEETGNNKVDTRALNSALSNAKATNGDKYLTKASEENRLPLKTEKDFVDLLKFKLMYSAFIEEKANITPENIQSQYATKEKTKYCATHILVEDEAGAKQLQAKINEGNPSFDTLVAQATELQTLSTPEKTNTNTNTAAAPKKLSMNDIVLENVKIKQFADLGCEPTSSFVPEFSKALEELPENSTSKEPVKTTFGYHIIQLKNIERKELDKKLSDEIKAKLLKEKQNTPGFTATHLKQLLDSVDVTMTNELVKAEYDRYKKSVDDQAATYVDPNATPASTSNNETSSSAN
ncbi:MAG: peptidylprolyl isomerase [Culicoidibacterales bacterium]